jgi:hypothetical protein
MRATTSPSDFEVYRLARMWAQRHGRDATARARVMVYAMREKGDSEGADVWLRIIVAIDALSEALTGERR